MEEKQAFFVESTDGRKFKMVIRGDVGKLSVAKIRRYLKSYGIPDDQQLLAGQLVLEDDMLGEQFGLVNDGVLHLQERQPVRPPQPSPRSAAPPAMAAQGVPHRLSPSYAPQEAWHEPPDEAPPHDSRGLEEEVQRLRRELAAAESRNADLQRQMQSSSAAAVSPQRHRSAPGDQEGLQCAKESLVLLAQKLRAPLQLDRNLTCVVGTDEDFSLLITYDPATERLYLYSTLLTQLPADPVLRNKLYEILLEGALLGREVCGGGVGLSTQNNVVVLTSSLPMRHCAPEALAELMPVFVETLERWRGLVDELLR